MNRRQLITGALSAAMLRVSVEWGMKVAPPAPLVYDFVAYEGDYRWLNIATKEIK